MIFSNGSAKETLATIAGRGAVVLPRGAIAAYGACLWEDGVDCWTGESQDGTTRYSCAHAQICVCNRKQIFSLFDPSWYTPSDLIFFFIKIRIVQNRKFLKNLESFENFKYKENLSLGLFEY